jgi:hypothetical protein
MRRGRHPASRREDPLVPRQISLHCGGMLFRPRHDGLDADAQG